MTSHENKQLVPRAGECTCQIKGRNSSQKNTPKGFALKLFELLFRKDEAKTGSVEGKGEKLLKLDPNRIAAVKECTELTFSGNENVEWATIKKCIDEKCRMVRNDRCFVWAGINLIKKEWKKDYITAKVKTTKRTIVSLLKTFKGLRSLLTLRMHSSLFDQNNWNVAIIIQVWFKQLH